MYKIVFWQQIANDHMAGLIKELSLQGHDVTYIVRESVSEERAKLGWEVPEMEGVNFIVIKDNGEALQLLAEYSDEAVHFVEGLRGNGYIAVIIRELRLKQARWGAMMETVDDRYSKGFIKRLLYWRILKNHQNCPDFILAIGDKMPEWLVARGYSANSLYSFSYFLADGIKKGYLSQKKSTVIRIGFVGRLIKLKRLDLLIDALGMLKNYRFELVVVGVGSLSEQLYTRAIDILGESSVHFHGQLSMSEAHNVMSSLDTLVLPSDYDGWGAVVSEALLLGVPAICSDACGASVIVRESKVGGIFSKGSVDELYQLLQERMNKGYLKDTERQKISEWALCISAVAGAKYVQDIIGATYYGEGKIPLAPYLTRE